MKNLADRTLTWSKIYVVMALMILGTILPGATASAAPLCIDFQDLPLGTGYTVGQSFISSGVQISTEDFQWASGTWTSSGYTQVENGGMAGGMGHEMAVNNINLLFDIANSLGHPVKAIEMRFGEYGGNINFSVNGDFFNTKNFADLDGLIIGGAQISVSNGFGNDMGMIRILGPVEQLMVGGQELWIDDVCLHY